VSEKKRHCYLVTLSFEAFLQNFAVPVKLGHFVITSHVRNDEDDDKVMRMTWAIYMSICMSMRVRGTVRLYNILKRKIDTRWLGYACMIGQLLPTVVEHQALGILHTLLEMFSYRLHHTQIHYRVQLLSHLYTLASIQQANQNQLHLW
jgi:hypothetical protein